MPIHTRHGSLDETALEAFQDDFEPERILRAIEDLDRVKHGISAMQEELRELQRISLMKWQNLRQTLMQSGTTNRIAIIAPFFD